MDGARVVNADFLNFFADIWDCGFLGCFGIGSVSLRGEPERDEKQEEDEGGT